MEERTTGIILRVRPYTETSLIIQWLTADHGRISTLARGARRPKSPFRGKLDLFYRAALSFQRSRSSTLHALREVMVEEMHPKLRRDPLLLHQVAYAAHLVELATETDTPIPAIHALFVELVRLLAEGKPDPVLVMAFEIKFLAETGLAPQPEDERMSDAVRTILKKMIEEDWAMLARLRLSAPQFNELRQFLHGFLIYHLGKLPGGRAEALVLVQPP